MMINIFELQCNLTAGSKSIIALAGLQLQDKVWEVRRYFLLVLKLYINVMGYFRFSTGLVLGWLRKFKLLLVIKTADEELMVSGNKETLSLMIKTGKLLQKNLFINNFVNALFAFS